MAIVKGTDNGELIDGITGATNDGDVIKGMGGDDRIYAGGGDDVIQGGLGGDYMDGGDDEDTANYIDSISGVTVNLLTGKGQGGSAEGDTLYQIENVTGSNFDDILLGDGGDNKLYGRDGKDTLKGAGGQDELFGGAGSDVLYGNQDSDELWGESGNDQLFGGTGFDWLVGGEGRDTMTGESGPDAFVWYAAKEMGVTQATADRITDFNAAEGDWIDLAGVDANVYATGNQAFTFIGNAAFTLDTTTADPTDVMPGEIRYYHAGGNTYIEIQTGNAADVEGVIRIDGIVTPEASWFVL
jgi:Ca2+-binding RTX toxin-like protein